MQHGELTRALHEAGDALASTQVPLATFAEYLAKQSKESFSAQETPDGKAWPRTFAKQSNAGTDWQNDEHSDQRESRHHFIDSQQITVRRERYATRNCPQLWSKETQSARRFKRAAQKIHCDE